MSIPSPAKGIAEDSYDFVEMGKGSVSTEKIPPSTRAGAASSNGGMGAPAAA
jgi:hypothetical protein